MREIKFRVFDQIKKTMNTVTSMWGFPEIETVCVPFEETVNTLFYSFELMQFTGLKDKNGVHIYEGDIVKLSFNEYYSNECVNVDEDTIVTGKITFEDGGYFINEKDSTWFYLYDMTDCAEIEIIGNIHENPKLL